MKTQATELEARVLQQAPVYVATDEGEVIEEAARDLAHYLKAIAGVDLQIRSQEPPGEGETLGFLLGRYAVEDGLEIPQTRFGVDGFAIDVNDGSVRMAGESDQATYFAVAHFLELQGIRWYTTGPLGEVVPERDSIVLPAAPIRETPAMWYRRPWYHGGTRGASEEDQRQFHLWALRNKAIGGVDVGNGHMWSDVVEPHGGLEQLSQDHPEWFYRPGDEPTWENTCILQPGIIELFVDYYKGKLKGQPAEVHRVFSICPDFPLFSSFELKTYSACLGEQGWERYRGAIWYRQEFPMPDTPAGSRLHLLLAGVDADATVWLDGREIGCRQSGSFDPHLLELPRPDFAGGEHVLTIRVINEAITELGTGGIIRPVCLIVVPNKPR